MLMLAIDLARAPTALVVGPMAAEEAALRRLAQLDAAMSNDRGCIAVFAPAPGMRLAARAGERLMRRLPTSEDLAGARIVFAMGLADAAAAGVAAAARSVGALVNVEDRTALCDFHMPALVQRGDLQIAITTGARAPGLAGRIRRYLEHLFPRAWSARLYELAERRRLWRASGADRTSIGRWTDELIDRRGWLQQG